MADTLLPSLGSALWDELPYQLLHMALGSAHWKFLGFQFVFLVKYEGKLENMSSLGVEIFQPALSQYRLGMQMSFCDLVTRTFSVMVLLTMSIFLR